MPLARIDLSRRASAATIRHITEAIYDAMVEVANVPLHDKFQVVTRHDDDELVYPAEGYLGTQYTPDIVIIQVTWVGGRSVDAKKAFYRLVADRIHECTGLRKEDVWITLVDNAREDWSFGGGVMQYAPAG
ncbi:tautomerase family protein [Luteibacter yeojuensis]|uniref:4-oxalocrotonate tautomerase n=1 Tax=Luteibacter yeojuensis TaxID=345309 RepID=A0A0F3K4M0_9GAMM|nr:tautomerase family protein [Luteibacter yeojuensis]KJV26138.1 4-oxalocrotonate tautomerase [Luteibacter yeojuensis]